MAREPVDVLEALDEQQRTAVTAPAGPVCILAGAGTGKTRAITHRIAYRVLSGEIEAAQVLAVTFTARAAGEMRGRLRELGVGGTQTRTFHAAAMRQLRYFAPRVLAGRAMPELVDHKARLVGQAATSCRLKLDRAALRDVTAEVEWAKSTLVEPDSYAGAVGASGRVPPLPADQLAEVFRAYEQLKRRLGVIDFEDLLRATVWAIEEHRDVAEQIRAQYRYFVVDEYQDVNPLQQRLLDAWLGPRNDLSVVGDASQTIYTFAGATSSYLVDFPQQFADAVIVRLERDYRSTPQVVALANQVIAAAQGPQASLRLQLVGQRTDGPQPRITSFVDEEAEASAVVAECQKLLHSGVSAASIAVLFRTNAQSQVYEQALAAAGVPYLLYGAERFFERPEIREAVILLRGAARSEGVGSAVGPGDLAAAVREVLAAMGFSAEQPPPTGGASRERWEALAALVRLAEEFAATTTSLADFVTELAERTAAQHTPVVEGVTLASLHAAKGLEWHAVFIVGVAEGMLPIAYATTAEQIEEERRLLYVGVTRAQHFLWLSWAQARSPGGRPNRRPSRFLPSRGSAHSRARGREDHQDAEAAGARRLRTQRSLPVCRSCGVALFDPAQRKLRRCSACPAKFDEALFAQLREWRGALAKEQQVPAFVIFTDATLQVIAEECPADESALAVLPGIGPRKLNLYGADVLRIVANHPNTR